MFVFTHSSTAVAECSQNAPMSKRLREMRDPLHDFIPFDEDELQIIESPPFQRLRHIHQLALTYKVYPGATHKRFEHSLGVMHLAGRVYDVITRADRIHPDVRETVPHPSQSDFGYWRTVVRMAALCHDMGHLPFSHAAEDELLPDGYDHEALTWKIVHCEAMLELFDSITPPIRPLDVAKLAIGGKKAERLRKGIEFSNWEGILTEVIVGDSFGVDRMDYLLRDSLHTGVQYGRFDHERLINTLRVIPEPAREEAEAEESSTPPVLGCTRGGLQSAEQLLLARYFMFSQVYHHPTRLAYNEHLKEFLKRWLKGSGGVFPIDVEGHLSRDDSDVLVAIKLAAENPSDCAHEPACRILSRNHFKKAYTKMAARPGPDGEEPGDTSEDVQALASAAAEHFGGDLVAYGAPPSKKEPPDFAVQSDDGRSSEWAKGVSDVLGKLPRSPNEYVLADAGIREEVRRWLLDHRKEILGQARADRIKEAEEEQGA